jgi:hypothetical protein
MDFRFDAFPRSADFRTLMFASDDERLKTDLELLRLILEIASGVGAQPVVLLKQLSDG